MWVQAMDEEACRAFLEQAQIGRLGCAFDGQPYVMPMVMAYEADRLYALTTFGQKIDWMRQNPKVCVLFDEIRTRFDWVSVIVYGRYLELVEPRYSEQRQRGRALLAQRERWWETPLAAGQVDAGEHLIEPILFAVEIDTVSGLRTTAMG
ncbi:pyridoxamine 5'-phosphate oxidase family protein [Candidatus Methylocalor cossyra]|uniref:Pyridoxamine 5'-phosphate oxidase family protein n=1 Tax=Candidatus Methylocalor cossyra TaxID=3108543 RepID=A0ABM9NE79_9GAMM